VICLHSVALVVLGGLAVLAVRVMQLLALLLQVMALRAAMDLPVQKARLVEPFWTSVARTMWMSKLRVIWRQPVALVVLVVWPETVALVVLVILQMMVATVATVATVAPVAKVVLLVSRLALPTWRLLHHLKSRPMSHRLVLLAVLLQPVAWVALVALAKQVVTVVPVVRVVSVVQVAQVLPQLTLVEPNWHWRLMAWRLIARGVLAVPVAMVPRALQAPTLWTVLLVMAVTVAMLVTVVQVVMLPSRLMHHTRQQSQLSPTHRKTRLSPMAGLVAQLASLAQLARQVLAPVVQTAQQAH
jgi:hypothetical protein